MKRRFTNAAVVLATTLLATCISVDAQKSCDGNNDNLLVSVFLTISPLASVVNNGTTTVQRQMELNWYNNLAPRIGDWVGLFRYDPKNSTILDPLDRSWIGGRREGFYKTNVQFPRFNFTVDHLSQDRCLNFWAGYVRNGSALVSSCIKIRPQWMWTNKDTIGNLALTRLMVPGTHNAGSYEHYQGLQSEDVVTRFKICQEEDIWTQLLFGIRHFDFRVSYYRNHPQNYWINHGLIKVNPFSIILHQIKTFAQKTREILFLDFHQFPVGFRRNSQRHESFITMLLDHLGDHLVPRSYGYHVRLDDIWRQNKTIVIFYSDEHYELSEFLWPGLRQVWAKANNINSLKRFFDSYMMLDREKPPVWSAMAELTPTIWDIVSKPSGNLRVLADQVNRNVTVWFRDLWFQQASVVATDFFLGNNIIEVAIDINRRRASCTQDFPAENERK